MPTDGRAKCQQTAPQQPMPVGLALNAFAWSLTPGGVLVPVWSVLPLSFLLAPFNWRPPQFLAFPRSLFVHQDEVNVGVRATYLMRKYPTLSFTLDEWVDLIDAHLGSWEALERALFDDYN